MFFILVSNTKLIVRWKAEILLQKIVGTYGKYTPISLKINDNVVILVTIDGKTWYSALILEQETIGTNLINLVVEKGLSFERKANDV